MNFDVRQQLKLAFDAFPLSSSSSMTGTSRNRSEPPGHAPSTVPLQKKRISPQTRNGTSSPPGPRFASPPTFQEPRILGVPQMKNTTRAASPTPLALYAQATEQRLKKVREVHEVDAKESLSKHAAPLCLSPPASRSASPGSTGGTSRRPAERQMIQMKGVWSRSLTPPRPRSPRPRTPLSERSSQQDGNTGGG